MLILASGSPRRRELLSILTADFTVHVSDVEEAVPPGLTPAETVQALAKCKGEAVWATAGSGDTLIAADTVVVIDGEILGKPQNAANAAEMLARLSGRTHTVYTGVWLKTEKNERSFYEATEVEFYPLTKKEIADYIATGEPFDKAGAYGIQNKGALLVKSLKGDYFNVVGFPIARVARELRALGTV